MRKYIENPIIVATVSCMVMVLFFLLSYRNLPPQIPLFFSLKEGDSQIGDLWMIIIFPTLVLLFLSLHQLLTTTVFKNDVFVKTLLKYSSIALSVLFGLICIKIILLIS